MKFGRNAAREDVLAQPREEGRCAPARPPDGFEARCVSGAEDFTVRSREVAFAALQISPVAGSGGSAACRDGPAHIPRR